MNYFLKNIHAKICYCLKVYLLTTVSSLSYSVLFLYFIFMSHLLYNLIISSVVHFFKSSCYSPNIDNAEILTDTIIEYV